MAVRSLWALAAIVVLTACSPTQKATLSTLGVTSWLPSAPPAPSDPVEYVRAQARDLGWMSLVFRRDGSDVWAQGTAVQIRSRQGIVVQTVGRANDLLGDVWLGSGAAAYRQGWSSVLAQLPFSITRQRSLAVGLPEHQQTYQLVQQGQELRLDSHQRPLETLRLVEQPVASPANTVIWPGAVYWVTPDGRLVASQQWLSPTESVLLTFEVPVADNSAAKTTSAASSSIVVSEHGTRLSALLATEPTLQHVPPHRLWVSQQRDATAFLQRRTGLLADLEAALWQTSRSSWATARQVLRDTVLPVRFPRIDVPVTDPFWLSPRPQRDPVLMRGDVVTVLPDAQPIRVWSLTQPLCSVAWQQGLTLKQVLSQCPLPATVETVQLRAWMGQHTVGVAAWNAGSPSLMVWPGSWVVGVPKDSNLSAYELAEHLWSTAP